MTADYSWMGQYLQHASVAIIGNCPGCGRAILENMWSFLLDSLQSQAETIGFWAGLLTTVAFAPQLVKAWKTGGEGLSWAMLTLYGAGVGLWFVYGMLRESASIMAANALTGAQVLAIFALKVRHAHVSRRLAPVKISEHPATPDKTALP